MRQLLAAALLALATVPATVGARPLYFENFTTLYGIASDSPIYACGVCHRKWGGTGPRNPFGSAIEQQLYVGKTIVDALHAVEGLDSDGDGFTNVDEITSWATLPGFSCANWTDALDTPSYFQSIITPGVPSCLEPRDIRVDPTTTSFITEVGKSASAVITVYNNGSTDPLTVTAVGMAPGSDAGYGATAPSLPAIIPLGGSITVSLGFAPLSAGFHNGALRITSDDPDEPNIDVPATGLGVIRILAPAADRAACLADVERAAERVGRVEFGEWNKCYLAELGGVACDAGRRDQRIAHVESLLRRTVGGAADRHCVPKSITPNRLGMATTCGGGCDAIELHGMSDLAECIVCRQHAANDAVLEAAVGAAPPDLPTNRPGPIAKRCNQAIARNVEKALRNAQKLLAACALSNVTAATPVDCAATLSSAVAAIRTAADATTAKCRDTSGLAGCLFGPPPDPACLGTTAVDVASDLVGTVFP